MVGALIVALFLRGSTARLVAAVVVAGDFLLSVLVFMQFDKHQSGLQMVERYTDWIPNLKIEYFLDHKDQNKQQHLQLLLVMNLYCYKLLGIHFP